MFLHRAFADLRLDRGPHLDAVVVALEGDAAVTEGGTAGYALSWTGHVLLPGETLSLDLTLAFGTAVAGDLAQSLAAALDAALALTSGITRAGTRLTWQPGAPRALLFSLVTTAAGSGDRTYSLSLSAPSAGRIDPARAAVTTTIGD